MVAEGFHRTRAAATGHVGVGDDTVGNCGRGAGFSMYRRVFATDVTGVFGERNVAYVELTRFVVIDERLTRHDPSITGKGHVAHCKLTAVVDKRPVDDGYLSATVIAVRDADCVER